VLEFGTVAEPAVAQDDAGGSVTRDQPPDVPVGESQPGERPRGAGRAEFRWGVERAAGGALRGEGERLGGGRGLSVAYPQSPAREDPWELTPKMRVYYQIDSKLLSSVGTLP